MGAYITALVAGSASKVVPLMKAQQARADVA